MFVDVEQGEVLAGLAGLEVRPLQHDDQPLLLLLGNLNKRHILAFRIYCKRICRIMHLWRGGLFDKLSLLSSNLALFSHHMDRGSEVIGVLNLYNKYTAFIGRCYMLHWSKVDITIILVFGKKIHGVYKMPF